MGLRQVGALQSLELRSFDQLVRLRPDEPADPRLLIVGITDDDIRSLKQYPITDRTLLQALEKLETHQPLAIGLDIIRDVAIGEGQAELLEYLRQSESMIAACKVRDQTAAGFPPPQGMSLEQVGAVNLGVDPDGILRRAILTLTPPETTQTPSEAGSLCDDPKATIPYFGLQLAIRYLEAMNVPFELTESQEHIKFGSTVFQPLEPNTGPYRSSFVGGKQGYQLLINYRSGQQVAQTVTLRDVLNGKVNANLVKDRIVLIGYTARTVKDEFFTPFNQKQNVPPMPGVVAHAQVISQLLSAVLDRRPLFWFWNPWLEAVWILGWSLAGGVLAWWIRRPIVLIVLITGTLVVLFTSCYGLLALTAGWVPMTPSVFAILLTAGGVVLFSRGYAQAIYQGVRGLLKLDIQIDVEQKEREVTEITESDYFQQLQSKSEHIRRQKTDSADDRPKEATASPHPALEPEPTQVSEPPKKLVFDVDILSLSPQPPAEQIVDVPSVPSQPTERAQEPAEMEALEYLQQIQHRSQELRRNHASPEPVPTHANGVKPASASPIQPDMAFFQQIQRKSQELRQQRSQQKQSVAPPANLVLPDRSPTVQPPSLQSPSSQPQFPQPQSPASHPNNNHQPDPSSLSQMLTEIDAYYEQLKQQTE